jgi:hypothetical protein
MRKDEPLPLQQTLTLEFIDLYWRQHHKPPTLALVAAHFHIVKSCAQHHMNELRKKGLLRGPKVVGQWELTVAGKKRLLT